MLALKILTYVLVCCGFSGFAGTCYTTSNKTGVPNTLVGHPLLVIIFGVINGRRSTR